MYRDRLTISTAGKGLTEITDRIESSVRGSGIKDGLCHLLLCHTSASLTLMENADPTARRDLEAYFDKLVPENLPYFEHTHEGPDDMPSHIRSVLTKNEMSLPVSSGQLELGTWQGVFLWEHRAAPHSRRLVVSVF